MLVVRTDDNRTVIVHDSHNTVDACKAYSYARRQHDANRIVIIADCRHNGQMDALWATLFETRHWTTFLDYVASVLYPHEKLREGDSDA